MALDKLIVDLNCKFTMTLCPFFYPQLRKKTSLTDSEREEAEKLKSEGNDLMRSEQFEAAIDKYSK
jgi:hypothetical protein